MSVQAPIHMPSHLRILAFCLALLLAPGLPKEGFCETDNDNELPRGKHFKKASAFIQRLHHESDVTLGVRVGVGPQTGLRALIASRNIRQDQPIFELPVRWLLFQDTATPAVQKGIQQCCRKNLFCADAQVGLSIALLAEKRLGKKSRFWAYIRALPKTTSSVVYFSAVQRNFSAAWRAAALVEEIVGGMQELLALSPNAVKPTPDNEECRWAVAQVLARSFSGRFLHLNPVLDFANHHWNPDLKSFQVLWHETDSSPASPKKSVKDACSEHQTVSRIVLIARHDLRKGDEVLHHYGGDNLQLLFQHGFTSPNNTSGPTVYALYEKLSDKSVQLMLEMGCEVDKGKNETVRVRVRLDRDMRNVSEILNLAVWALSEDALQCVRMAEVASSNPDALQVAVESGKLSMPEDMHMQALKKVEAACAQQFLEYKRDVDAGRLLSLRNETGAATLSQALAVAFEENLAMLKGCVVKCRKLQQLSAMPITA